MVLYAQLSFNLIFKKKTVWPLTPPQGSSLCVRSDYVLACCCIRDSISFDLQHDHFLKRLQFDLWSHPRVGGGGGGCLQTFATMLLHSWFHLIWYAAWPCSEKVEFRPFEPGRVGGLQANIWIFATMLLHASFPLILYTTWPCSEKNDFCPFDPAPDGRSRGGGIKPVKPVSCWTRSCITPTHPSSVSITSLEKRVHHDQLPAVLYLHFFKTFGSGHYSSMVQRVASGSLQACFYSHWRSSHYAGTYVRNKNSNIQGRSPNVVKVIFHTKGTALKGKNSLPLGANSFL